MQRHIHASNVAAFIGLHPYRDAADAWLDVYNRTQPKKSAPVEAPAPVVSPVEKYVADIKVPATIQQMQTLVEKKHQEIVKSEPAETAGAVFDATRSAIQCAYGTFHEKNSLELYAEKYITPGREYIREDPKYRYCSFSTCWSIGGKVDGLLCDAVTEDTIAVLEVKNRARSDFDCESIPLYERIQCECYMRIWQVKKAYHIQTFRTTDGAYQHVTPLDSDDQLWDTVVLAKLKQACATYERLLKTNQFPRLSSVEPEKKDQIMKNIPH